MSVNIYLLFASRKSVSKKNAVRGPQFQAQGLLPYMGYIGMCGLKGYNFLAVLVINRVRLELSSLKLGMSFRYRYF